MTADAQGCRSVNTFNVDLSNQVVVVVVAVVVPVVAVVAVDAFNLLLLGLVWLFATGSRVRFFMVEGVVGFVRRVCAGRCVLLLLRSCGLVFNDSFLEDVTATPGSFK